MTDVETAGQGMPGAGGSLAPGTRKRQGRILSLLQVSEHPGPANTLILDF